MPKKGEYVKIKNYERKIMSPFIIYVDYESNSVSADNRKQNPEEFYTNKLVCVDGQFSIPFKTYLGEDAVYNFIKYMIEESKYCIDLIKKI